MNDIKKPEDEHFEDGFTEDFDFGENNHTEPHAASTLPPASAKPQGSNKKLLVSVGLIAVFGITYLSYKFYFKNELKTALRSTLSGVKPVSKPEPSQSPSPSPSPNPQPPSPTPVAPPTALPTEPAVPTTPSPTTATPGVTGPAPMASVPPTTTTPPAPLPAPAQTNPNFPPETPIGPKIATVPPPPPAPVLPPSPPPINPKEADQLANLTQALDKLYHQMDYNLSQIRHLDNYTRDLSQTLTKLNETIKAMEQRLSTVTHTTSSLSKDVGMVRNQVGQVQQILGEDILELPEAPIRRKAKCAEQCDPEYVVHAVIPGRAWLKSSKGQIITVTEGEVIGNYGKILVIDAANSVILTSSGFTFR